MRPKEYNWAVVGFLAYQLIVSLTVYVWLVTSTPLHPLSLNHSDEMYGNLLSALRVSCGLILILAALAGMLCFSMNRREAQRQFIDSTRQVMLEIFVVLVLFIDAAAVFRIQSAAGGALSALRLGSYSFLTIMVFMVRSNLVPVLYLVITASSYYLLYRDSEYAAKVAGNRNDLLIEFMPLLGYFAFITLIKRLYLRSACSAAQDKSSV